MVTTKYCSYRGCSNDSRFPNISSMINKYGEPVFFVKFPGKNQKEKGAGDGSTLAVHS